MHSVWRKYNMSVQYCYYDIHHDASWKETTSSSSSSLNFLRHSLPGAGRGLAAFAESGVAADQARHGWVPKRYPAKTRTWRIKFLSTNHQRDNLKVSKTNSGSHEVISEGNKAKNSFLLPSVNSECKQQLIYKTMKSKHNLCSFL